MKKKWFEIKNAADKEPLEILIYDQIGKDWWDDSGVGAKDFATALKEIPKDREIYLRINSPGGSVWDGMAIYNQLAARRKYIDVIVDGVAASIASVIALCGRKLTIPSNALYMIHDPWGIAQGNADEMRKAADMLDKHKDAIVNVYEERTGLTRDEIESLMTEETWMTGDDALERGFCSDVSAAVVINNTASNFDMSIFRQAPEIHNAAPAAKPGAAPMPPRVSTPSQRNERTDIMRDTILAKLKELGITVANDISDADLMAAYNKAITPEPAAQRKPKDDSNVAIADLQSRVNAQAALIETQRLQVLRAEFDRVAENRVPMPARDAVFASIAASQDPQAAIAQIKVDYNEQLTTPAAPVVDVVGDDPRDVGRHIDRLNQQVQDNLRSGNVEKNSELAGKVRNTYLKHRDALLGVFNANTISTNLKRTAILQETLAAFIQQILPLNAFSTVFSNVAIEGGGTIDVPYFPLVGDASTDFNQSNGYVMGDSTQNSKQITVNKRKYQPIRFNSSELARISPINLEKIASMKGGRLAYDVFSDVLSAVTAATYGSAAFTGAASTFTYDKVVDIGTACDAADWPEMGRSLVLKHDYYRSLTKDTDLSDRSASGADTATTGRLPEVAGFQPYKSPHIPGNSENLVGLAAWSSGLLIATAPIVPDETVRGQLARYELVTDPRTGISFEYRLWGNADMDERREVIESNYGYAAGEAAAIKRLVSA